MQLTYFLIRPPNCKACESVILTRKVSIDVQDQSGDAAIKET